MNFRSLILLGIGIAFAGASPAFSATTTKQSIEPASASAKVIDQARSDSKPVKKVKKSAKKTDQTAGKKVAKKTTGEDEEKAKKEESRGLFGHLFGGSIKEKSASKEPASKSASSNRTTKAKKKPQPEPEAVQPIAISLTSNKGELRSEAVQQPPGLFASLFGGKPEPQLLPETRALDSVFQQRQQNKKFRVRPEFEPQIVEFTGYSPGTIVIDTDARFLYLVEGQSRARRYAIAVGKDGLQFKGTVTVGDKQEWPRWIPTKEMQQREPKKYGQYKDGMDGGPDNPLGARAIYLYQGGRDTHLRIHGTNQPHTIGTSSSNGCFRMFNDHVMDLYGRVKIGTPVVVL